MEFGHTPSGDTLLLFACRAGAVGAVRLLLQRGADFNPPRRDKRNAMHTACAAGQAGCVDAILGVSANAAGHTRYILRLPDTAGNTPLHCAAAALAAGVCGKLLGQECVRFMFPAGHHAHPSAVSTPHTCPHPPRCAAWQHY